MATDAFGHFSIRVAPGKELEISCVGYKTMTMQAARDMIVYLQPTTQMINEMVAIGYGTQKRADLTCAVSTVVNLNFIDPNDIQDISVLKNAASAAVYGACASFYVILVTTKSAEKKDKLSLSYNANFEWSTPTIIPNFVRSYEDAEASFQAYYRGNGASNKSVMGDMLYEEMNPVVHGGMRGLLLSTVTTPQ